MKQTLTDALQNAHATRVTARKITDLSHADQHLVLLANEVNRLTELLSTTNRGLHKLRAPIQDALCHQTKLSSYMLIKPNTIVI